MSYSAETGIAIDLFAFLKYMIWWLLPTAMIVTSLGMFFTILTSTPVAILIQFVWWFIDGAITGLSGDTSTFTLMIRHNILGGSETISQDFTLICLNRGLYAVISLILVGLSILIYNKKRGGEFNYTHRVSRNPCPDGRAAKLLNKSMNIFRKNILGLLRIVFFLTFKNSLLLGMAYLFIIPTIRGISNLDNIQSAEVLGQSLALIGAIILIPVTKQELETDIKEIIYTKIWSYMKSVSIRLICSILLTAVMIFVFAFVMQICHCVFPFWKYISVTVMYAVFMGLLGLAFSQAGNCDVIGYLSVLGYWTFASLKLLVKAAFFTYSLLSMVLLKCRKELCCAA